MVVAGALVGRLVVVVVVVVGRLVVVVVGLRVVVVTGCASGGRDVIGARVLVAVLASLGDESVEHKQKLY